MTSTIIFVFSLLAQIGPGDITSPLGPSTPNTTSGGYGGLDRSAANLGGMNAPFAGSDAAKSAGSDTGSTSASTGASSSESSSSPETPTATGASSVGGGTSGGTGLGSSTGGMR